MHAGRGTARLARADVGAWLFRCSPRTTELAALRRPGGIDSRCAIRTYRLDLIHAGDPVVLWLTGPARAATTPGVWMLGYTTGDIEGRDSGGTLPSVRLRDMTPLATPVPRSELAMSPATHRMEVLRQPFGPNPSYLTPLEHRELTALVGAWPT